LKEWNALGFRRENGKAAAKLQSWPALLFLMMASAAFLVFFNYDIIMDWNRSIYFATSVCLLADKIGKK